MVRAKLYFVTLHVLCLHFVRGMSQVKHIFSSCSMLIDVNFAGTTTYLRPHTKTLMLSQTLVVYFEICLLSYLLIDVKETTPNPLSIIAYPDYIPHYFF